MNLVEKILVLIESKEQVEPLLAKARHLATASEAKLELFYCCYSQSLSSKYLFDEEQKNHAKMGFMHGVEKWLEELVQQLLAEGIEASADVCWERHMERGMLTKIERYDPDLVLKDCRYHHRLDQHLFGHVDWELIRHAKVPLLLVRPSAWNQCPTIIAAVDPIHSHEKSTTIDMLILKRSKQICDWLQGKLKVFHSFQPLPMSVILDDTLVLDYERFRDKLRNTHQQALEVLLEQFGLAEGVVEAYLAEGDTHAVLPEFLDKNNADVVVLGAVNRSSLDRFFIGSTSEITLDHIHCDVLIVKDLDQ
ncbi:MAG: universal stress protein [Motiliproteus sp.]|nr:universal stress protein [Motiliproteus sp.]MCW9054277.1 universal stress protein [Motiliproteus sp.]